MTTLTVATTTARTTSCHHKPSSCHQLNMSRLPVHDPTRTPGTGAHFVAQLVCAHRASAAAQPPFSSKRCPHKRDRPQARCVEQGVECIPRNNRTQRQRTRCLPDTKGLTGNFDPRHNGKGRKCGCRKVPLRDRRSGRPVREAGIGGRSPGFGFRCPAQHRRARVALSQHARGRRSIDPRQLVVDRERPLDLSSLIELRPGLGQ